MKKKYILEINNKSIRLKEETAYSTDPADIITKPTVAGAKTIKGAAQSAAGAATYAIATGLHMFSDKAVRAAIRSDYLAAQKRAEATFGEAFSQVADQLGLNILTLATNPSKMFSLYVAKKAGDITKELTLDDPNFRKIIRGGNLMDLSNFIVRKSMSTIPDVFKGAYKGLKDFKFYDEKNQWKKSKVYNYKEDFDKLNAQQAAILDEILDEMSSQIDLNSRREIEGYLNQNADSFSDKQKKDLLNIIDQYHKEVSDDSST